MSLHETVQCKLSDERCTIVNNVDRATIKKKVLMLRSEEVDPINNRDVYLSEKV